MKSPLVSSVSSVCSVCSVSSVFSVFFVSFVSIVSISCQNQPRCLDQDQNTMRYAQLITMTDNGDVTIINPWDTSRVLQQLHLDTPISNAAVCMTTHCALLDELGLHGFYHDFSNMPVPDVESLIDADIDAVLVSPFENSGGYEQLQKLGIPLIYCADYMETSPLSRAEWMRFYARLFGTSADSLFNAVEQQYLALTKSPNHQTTKSPTVACDLISGSTWYVPGGCSTIGRLIADAGGNYVYADNDSKGSLSLSPEAVFEACQDADIWIIRYVADCDMTYDNLASESPLYSQMKAFQNHRVFGCDLEKTHFFEETPFHPERLMKNLQHIFSGNNPDSDTAYYKPLKLTGLH